MCGVWCHATDGVGVPSEACEWSKTFPSICRTHFTLLLRKCSLKHGTIVAIAITISAMRQSSIPTRLFILAAILACFLFAAVATDVVCKGALERYDHVLAKQIYTWVGDANLWLAMCMTGWGSSPVTIPLVILGGIRLAYLRRWEWLVFWICTLVGVGLLNPFLKAIFHRPRPTHYAYIMVEHGWSFPSGHTMGALVVWGTLAYVLAKLYPTRKIVAGGIVIVSLLVSLVTTGLLYVGVHYLTDILGAYTAGGAWLALCIGIMEFWLRRNKTEPIGIQ